MRGHAAHNRCAMNQPVRHHQVPDAYLAQFSDLDGWLWVYAPGEKEPRRSRPANVAVETDRYSVLRADGTRDVRMEEALGVIESAGLPALRSAAAGEALGDQPRYDLATFIAALHLRTDSMRQRFAEFEARIMTGAARMMTSHKAAWAKFSADQSAQGKTLSEADRLKAHEFISDPSRYEVHIRKDATMTPMAGLRTAADLIFEMKWTLIEAPPGESFIASDNPVAVGFAATRVNGFVPRGLASRDAEMTVPLTPAKLLVMHWRQNAQPNVTCDRQMLKQLNRIRAGYAERAIFANHRSDGLWRLAKKHVGAVHASAESDEAPVRMVRPRKMMTSAKHRT